MKNHGYSFCVACICFWLSNGGSHWLPFYESPKITVSVKNHLYFSAKEKKNHQHGLWVRKWTANFYFFCELINDFHLSFSTNQTVHSVLKADQILGLCIERSLVYNSRSIKSQCQDCSGSTVFQCHSIMSQGSSSHQWAALFLFSPRSALRSESGKCPSSDSSLSSSSFCETEKLESGNSL